MRISVVSNLSLANMAHNLYRLAAQYIPLAKGEAQPLTNPDINRGTSHLDDWVLFKFGNVEAE